MKKKLIFVIILLLIIVAATVYYFVTKRGGSSVSQPAAAPSSPGINGSGDKIVIKTSQGDVLINNIEKDPVSKIAFDNSVVFKESKDYSMSYFPPDQGFIITLMSKNLATARTNAEKDFIDTLGISRDQGCFLKVTLNVPFDVSQEASGKNYGLSFCPNGKPLSTN